MHRRRLAIAEDEHFVTLNKDRLARAETRCADSDKELEELRRDYREATRKLETATRDAHDAKS